MGKTFTSESTYQVGTFSCCEPYSGKEEEQISQTRSSLMLGYIAKGPDHHRGVVAVARDHLPQLLQSDWGKGKAPPPSGHKRDFGGPALDSDRGIMSSSDTDDAG